MAIVIFFSVLFTPLLFLVIFKFQEMKKMLYDLWKEMKKMSYDLWNED